MIQQKSTQAAVAAMSRLAELYASGETATSADLAKARNLPQPLISKILSHLSRAGLVAASPGPKGGYRLAREPDQITLWDVTSLFERVAESPCPFGPGWCGNEDPCPIHETVVAIRQLEENYLKNTRFSVFAHYQENKQPRGTKRK